MTVDWADYEPFDPGAPAPLHTLPRREARAAYELLMAAKTDRIDQLLGLLRRSGIEADGSDASLDAIETWYRENIESDPEQPERLRPRWYAVINDLALYLGDVMIERAPALHWAFFEWGKKNAAYQRHVIMGFDVPNPRYNVDIDFQVAALG